MTIYRVISRKLNRCKTLEEFTNMYKTMDKDEYIDNKLFNNFVRNDQFNMIKWLYNLNKNIVESKENKEYAFYKSLENKNFEMIKWIHELGKLTGWFSIDIFDITECIKSNKLEFAEWLFINAQINTKLDIMIYYYEQDKKIYEWFKQICAKEPTIMNSTDEELNLYEFECSLKNGNVKDKINEIFKK